MNERRGLRVALVGPTHPAPGGIVHFTAGLADALAGQGETLVIGWSRRKTDFFNCNTPTSEGFQHHQAVR
jgi:hypothetical protein